MYIKKSDIEMLQKYWTFEYVYWVESCDDWQFIVIDDVNSLPTHNPYDEVINVIDDMLGNTCEEWMQDFCKWYDSSLQELKDKLLTK